MQCPSWVKQTFPSVRFGTLFRAEVNPGKATFVFAEGFGNDRIYDFDADPRRGQDMLDVSELGITAENFAELVDIDVACGNTVVTIGEDSIALLGVNGRGSNAITQADFIL